MRSSAPAVALWAVLLWMAVPSSGAWPGARASRPDRQDRFARTISVNTGTPVVVEATIGDLTIAAWDRPDIFIEVVRHAPETADLERYPIRLEATRDRLLVSVIQTGDGKDAALGAAISMRVPSTTVFERLEVFEGRIALVGLTRQINARIERGPIEASGLSGAVRLETVVGLLTLSAAKLDPLGVIRLRTFNGDVRLEFAEQPADARILALTLHGSISSTIPLGNRTDAGPRFGEATLGRGEPLVSVDVVNGDIKISSSAPPSK